MLFCFAYKFGLILLGLLWFYCVLTAVDLLVCGLTAIVYARLLFIFACAVELGVWVSVFWCLDFGLRLVFD